MSLRFFGDADGRLHLARRAIRKLIALGFDERDLAKLMRWRQGGGSRKSSEASGSGPDSGDRETRRRLAHRAIQTMIMLGFSESEIAALAEVDPSTVAHALDPFELRAIGADTALKLKKAVQTTGEERLKLLLPRLVVRVVDTCCDKGRSLDEATRTEVAASVRVVLRNALLCSAAPPSALPSGVDAFLAQIGEPPNEFWMFGDRPDGAESLEQQVVRAQRREHELDHLLQRFKEDRKRLEKLLGREDEPPKEGGIA